MKKLYGTGVALVTPFNDQSEIDFVALKKLIAFTSKSVDYLVVMGTTGESVTLNKEEKKKVLEFVKKNNKKGLPIVYGIGSCSTADALEMLADTDLTGVDAILSVSPYYNKPSQEGIYQHFKTIASKSSVPVILYNIPGRTGSNMTAETTLRLAEHKNIIGIKEASGNMEQCMKIASLKPDDFMLISGDDMFTLPLYSIGATGVISVLANAFPSTFKKMKDYAFANNYKKAQLEQFKLLEINGPMYEEGNPVGVKYVLSLMNICKEHVRLPHVSASAQLRKKIDIAFKKF